MFLTELPLIALLAAAIYYNNLAEGFIKFYPLIAVLILGMIFIVVYLFRYVSISVEEVRSGGLFSSRDRATINAGKTLILTRMPRKRMRVELFGNDGVAPMLDWAQGDGHEIMDIFLYREKAIGGVKTAARVLEFFEIPDEDIDEAVFTDGFSKEYEAVSVSTAVCEGKTEIRIKFTKTI